MAQGSLSPLRLSCQAERKATGREQATRRRPAGEKRGRKLERNLMAKKKSIEQIARKFQRKMQKIVDDGGNVTSISIEVGDEKYVIAEKKEKEDGL